MALTGWFVGLVSTSAANYLSAYEQRLEVTTSYGTGNGGAVPTRDGSCGDTMGAENERLWLAAYTRARHECVVAHQLERKQVEFLLPTYMRISRWSDRLKRVLAPLFPNYIFVHVSGEERLQVLQTAGVVRVVSVAGKPAELRDDEITMLRTCMARPNEVEPHPFLKVGQRVRVKHGPFAGWEGILTRKNNATRLVVSVEHLMRSVAVNFDDAEVEAVS